MTLQIHAETLSGEPAIVEWATVEEERPSSSSWDRQQQGLSSSEEAGRVEMRVKGRLTGRLLRFRILVRHDGLVLLGRVRTYYAKQLVQAAVLELTEMPIAENAVEVVCLCEESDVRQGAS
ncbi:MAG TPA: hypothetical protein VKU82_12100 [Planctomycetaceae bacterium]|nr:hypothetical protein [Planctomycetaceae bacterium]